VDGSARVTKDCDLRVIRGGGWFFEPRIVRSANRDGDSPVIRNNNLGFRVARTLTP
jgi:formylglycine-generating enzyme required for sulfatase activity